MHERSRPEWSGPRSNRGYVLLKVETVEDAAWLSQPEAARRRGVTLLRVAVLIVNRLLIPAEKPSRSCGGHDRQRPSREGLASERDEAGEARPSPEGHGELVLIADPQQMAPRAAPSDAYATSALRIKIPSSCHGRHCSSLLGREKRNVNGACTWQLASGLQASLGSAGRRPACRTASRLVRVSRLTARQTGTTRVMSRWCAPRCG